ncbi:MAG: glutathione S-transferase family protein [Deltaproteobacteria bacterium]|nr:glutathione S-transferase family protein [Deltaproteobacteria bacterium]
MDRLHYHPLSPYSRKAYVAGLMRGEPFERAVIELGSGALQRPEFLAISPFGKMPVLETAEGPIIESTSIIEHWEDRGPRKLLPAGRELTARHFDRVGDLYLVDPVAALWWEAEGETAKNAPQTARRAWRLFEKQLSGRPFVAGDAFSLGDLGASIATDYFVRLGVEAPAAIRGWCERCFAVPEMKRALEEALPFVERLHPSARARA